MQLSRYIEDQTEFHTFLSPKDYNRIFGKVVLFLFLKRTTTTAAHPKDHTINEKKYLSKEVSEQKENTIRRKQNKTK